MYAVIADQQEVTDALRHVFFAESVRDATFLAQEIADEDGLRALILKVIDAIDPDMPRLPVGSHIPHAGILPDDPTLFPLSSRLQ